MKDSLKRGAVFFLSLILCLSCAVSVSATPTAISDQAPFDVDAVSAVLMDVRTGKILYAKNPDPQL